MTNLNEHQNRALWASALRILADAIMSEAVDAPTTIQMFTQYVDLEVLLHIADFTDPSNPLPIKMLSDSQCCRVLVPVGRRLDVDIQWTYFTRNLTPIQREAIDSHNQTCVNR